jgi:hypothetical protein
MAGDWDDALERAEVFLAEIEGGSPHYQAGFSYITRSLIRLGRGDPKGAEQDAELAVEHARPIRDPQIVQTTLAKAAFVFLSVGNDARVDDVFSECFEGLKKTDRFGFAAIELHHVAWVARALGREAEVLELIEGESFKSPWLVTARAVAVGDLLRAADLLQEMCSVTDESFYRMHAAAQLVGEGRRAEADEQLRRALAFTVRRVRRGICGRAKRCSPRRRRKMDFRNVPDTVACRCNIRLQCEQRIVARKRWKGGHVALPLHDRFQLASRYPRRHLRVRP